MISLKKTNDLHSHFFNILELPEIVTHIFRNLDIEERARKRLVNTTFNHVYLIEEENEMLQLWKKYESGYCGGYYVKPLSDEELIALEQQFDMKMQYHLKIWLTKCSNGRFEWQQSLLSIANTGDWDYIINSPCLQKCKFELMDHFGDEIENFICVHFSSRDLCVMDKRNGKFYHSSNAARLYWKQIGYIREWLENISYDILYPLSELKGDHISAQFYKYSEDIKKLTSEGNMNEFLRFISASPQSYSLLSNEWKGKEEVIGALLSNNYEDPNGFFSHLPAHIPFDLRNDKEFLLKYFKIADFCYYIPTKLRNDKKFMKKLILQYNTCFNIGALPKDILRDTEILRSLSDSILLNSEVQEYVDWEFETVEQVKTFFTQHPESHISIPFISDTILNDKSAMIDILNEVYNLELKPEDTLNDLSAIEKIVNESSPMVLSIVDESIRNNKEFMMKLGEISLMFIGNELKTDLDLISSAKPTVLKKLNLIMSKQEFLELLERIQKAPTIQFKYLHNLNLFDALKYQIPREYFNDPEFAYETYRITSASEQYLGKVAKQDFNLWIRLARMELDLYGAPPELLVTNRDLAFQNIFSPMDLPDDLIFDEDFMITWMDNHQEINGFVCLPTKARTRKLFKHLLVKHPYLKKFGPPEWLEEEKPSK
ncbi:predicted protein [Naegleria gruberi]|uniref:Predicted protein n=1 Tax=Naegleria gruberi TaxID=5762 RepID=D2V4D3_NAEGR|nr:uncharacterized protein NAEGRDRAFT_63685 [Naegleria gruberi]EFC48365.1 predicted protein [Naegleria gruberi]|eukprot:XP_002681109.1 predicted protein [Naegleria gruberi strain NEG-M]